MNMAVAYGDRTTPYRTGIIEGFFIKHEGNKVIVEEYDGTLHSIPLLRNANLQIDGRNVAITDFKYGMEIYGEMRGRSISYMDAFSVDMPGYISPGGKLRTGIIKKIDRDQIQIKLPTGREETYFTSPATVVLKGKENVSLNALYEGDRVKLYFDDISTSFISRIQIEGDSILVKDLYKATLSIVDELEDVIVLENIEVFRNGKWQSAGNTMKISYGVDFPLYVGGLKIPYKNLKYYKGKTVYMAIKDFFGKDKIEKMVVKNQYETIYSDKIEEINWYSSQFELANRKNISFHEGTMVIKSGRLVDVYSLTPKSDGLVVADGRGSSIMADVIYIYNEDINNSNIGQDYIYAGRLDSILEGKLYLRDFFLLNRNDWESFDDKKELFYDNDTFIYDLEDNKKISFKEFFAGDYAVDEDNRRKRKLRDWYGYIYTDGDRVSSIYVKKKMDSLLKQRTTIGIVEGAPYDNNLMGWTIRVHDVKDWSSRHEEWMAKNASLNIYLKEAMIVKNGKRIAPEDLKPGDRLYMVREDVVGKIVVVK